MIKHTEKKRHIDCAWLIKKGPDIFQCCDARGNLKGKYVGNKEVHKICCQFFHAKEKKDREQSIVIQ